MPCGKRISLCLLLVTSLESQAMAQTHAVVYSDGRVFVRRTIIHELVRGSTVVALPNEVALAGSLISLDSGVSIIEARTPLPGDPAALLRKAVGRHIVFRLSATDTVGAVVLSADPTRYQLADGSVVVTMPGVILFPADIATPGRLASVTVQSTAARPRFDLGYVMNGIWWQAHYSLTLAGRRGRLSGTALLTSEGVGLDSAEITLLDGNISRVLPALTARTAEERGRATLFPVTGSFPLTPADSLRVYRIAGRFTLKPSEITSLPLMTDEVVDVVRVLSVPGILSNSQSSGRFSGGSASLPVSVVYHVSGAGLASFGPLPSGTARLYGSVGSGTSAVVAEAIVAEPGSGGGLDFSAGPSAEILATRILYEGIPEQDTVVSASGSRTVRAVATLFDEAVRLQNRTDSARVVEVVESREGSWSVVSSSVPPGTPTRGSVRFRIALPPRGSAVFTARLRVPVP